MRRSSGSGAGEIGQLFLGIAALIAGCSGSGNKNTLGFPAAQGFGGNPQESGSLLDGHWQAGQSWT